MMFNKDLIRKIQRGQKTVTRRTKLPHNKIQVGRIEPLMADRKYGTVLIKNAYKQKLKNITDLDAQEEGFSSLIEFKKYWTNILEYKWNPNQEVYVIEFKLHKIILSIL